MPVASTTTCPLGAVDPTARVLLLVGNGALTAGGGLLNAAAVLASFPLVGSELRGAAVATPAAA